MAREAHHLASEQSSSRKHTIGQVSSESVTETLEDIIQQDRANVMPEKALSHLTKRLLFILFELVTNLRLYYSVPNAPSTAEPSFAENPTRRV